MFNTPQKESGDYLIYLLKTEGFSCKQENNMYYCSKPLGSQEQPWGIAIQLDRVNDIPTTAVKCLVEEVKHKYNKALLDATTPDHVPLTNIIETMKCLIWYAMDQGDISAEYFYPGIFEDGKQLLTFITISSTYKIPRNLTTPVYAIWLKYQPLVEEVKRKQAEEEAKKQANSNNIFKGTHNAVKSWFAGQKIKHKKITNDKQLITLLKDSIEKSEEEENQAILDFDSNIEKFDNYIKNKYLQPNSDIVNYMIRYLENHFSLQPNNLKLVDLLVEHYQLFKPNLRSRNLYLTIISYHLEHDVHEANRLINLFNTKK